MNTFEAMKNRRSIRKFRPDPVPADILRELVDIARLYPSGGNLQPIRFALITDQALCDAVFADLRWAAYLPGYTIAENEKYLMSGKKFRIDKYLDLQNQSNVSRIYNLESKIYSGDSNRGQHEVSTQITILK